MVPFQHDFYPVRKLRTTSTSLGKDSVFIAGTESDDTNRVRFLGLKHLAEHLVLGDSEQGLQSHLLPPA